MIASGHAYNDVIRYTPRQLYAFVTMVIDRRRRDNATMVHMLHMVKASSSSKGHKHLVNTLKEWDK